jgi:hypothetical protein
MQHRQLFGLMLLLCCTACSKTPETTDQAQQQLAQQEAEQGYPMLIAMPEVAHYALPFCEKTYCIEVEIFGFNSQDQWFNQFTEQQIADLIRQTLGLKQKHSLQAAVDEFVRLSDAWQAEAEHRKQKAWRMYIQPRIAMQQGEIALLQIQTEYELGDTAISQANYFFVVNRKTQQQLRLYDVIAPEYRVEFMDFIQSQYLNWQQDLTAEQKKQLPEKLYWANQDWFFDEQGMAIYYRAADFSVTKDNLSIYLSPEQSKRWVQHTLLAQLNLLE